MIVLNIYIIVALVLSIYGLIVCRYDKNFDKFVHDTTNGQIEFTPWDKITVPIFAGFTWPIAAYIGIRKMIHG